MKIIVDNIATEYLDQGKGKTILMLHGWQDSLQTFDGISEILVKKYRVVRLDMPGFGKTEIPKESWDIDKYVIFVQSFIEKIGLEADVLLGHSFGGRVIIKGAGKGVLKPGKVVLVGSAGIAKGKTIKNIFITIFTKIFGLITLIPPLCFLRDKIRRKFYKLIGSDYLEAGSLRETYLKTIGEDLQRYAERIKVPTLLIWGENDSSTPLADGRKLETLIPKAKLEIIKNTGHFVHQENIARVTKLIGEFL